MSGPNTLESMSLQEFWDDQAGAWKRFARTPGHDVFHDEFNFPAFLELVPPPGQATFDVGCGEGRVGAELQRRGHHVVGVDSSPQMVALASEQHEAHVGDAAALPFPDGSFDLAIAYMSLMNFDDLEGAVREVGRVLAPGGRLCAALIHPLESAGRFEGEGADAPFVISGSYFEPEAKLWEDERDGISMTFWDRGVPVEQLSRALEAARLAWETIREPVPSESFVRDHPLAARRLRIPLLLHFRAAKR
jgi:SAM-dependent methyltransferase